MIPCITYSFFDESYKIYLRPTLAQSSDNLKATFGTQWDKVERAKVSGGVPQRWAMLPTLFKTMELALASIKVLK